MADPFSQVTTPILDEIIKNIVSLMKEEYSMVHGVKKDIEKLHSNVTAIQSVIEDAENKQVNNAQLKDWLKKLKNAACDAENILDTFATKAKLRELQKKQRFQSLSTSQTSYKRDAAQQIKRISERFDMIAKEKESFHLEIKVNGVAGQDISKRPNYAGSFVDKSGVVGREADKERITHMLLSNEFDKEGDVSVIPIIGMGGLGKTTLAQFVFNDPNVSDHFESRMWVCVTVDFDLNRILKEMIQFHSKMKFDDSSTSHLQSRLLEFLVGQRFLLVLDDVWTENYQTWEPLELLLKQGAKGSRVLVTSRITKVKDVIGTQPPHLLGYLPDKECLSLFSKIAFKGDSQRSKVLEDIGREIVGKCKGLPLAVKAMAGLLRGCVDVNKWRQIQSSEIWKIEDQNSNSGTDRPKILAILQLSYDHLPHPLKLCFAYCSLFPKAYVFHKKELVKHWIAQRFIQAEGQGLRAEEETASEYFNELLIRSFFQLSIIDDKEIFNMHDLNHDLAQLVSDPYCCQVKDNESYSFSEQSLHVSLVGKDVEQPVLKIVENAKNVRTILFPSPYLKNFGHQTLDKAFHKLKYIRTLDLSSSTILELPSSIEKLKLLRYLDLSRTEIKVLPNSICNLYNLQTLKLLGCPWLFELPKDLRNLVNLQRLELEDLFWVKYSILPPKLGDLTSLQDCHAFRVGDKNGYRIEELKNMSNLSGTLHISELQNAVNVGEAKLNEKEYLQKLVFEWSDKVVNTHNEATEMSVLEALQPHLNLKELKICHYKGSEFPAWMREGLLQNLVSVTLNHCTKCKTLTLGELSNLQMLHIKGMQELEKWPEVQCPSLNRLEFSNCPKLRELPNCFPRLRVLKIKRCKSLMALPVAPLMFLILIDNPNLENWGENLLTWESMNDEGQRSRRDLWSLSGLLELKVTGSPKLRALPHFFAPQKLEISGCELLVALPHPHFAQRLQHLALDACHDGTLVRAMPNTSSLFSLSISGISNLISFPKWPQLPGLKALYIRDCKDLVSLSESEVGSLPSLISLKLLSIRNCPMLVTLTKELPDTLECLSISSCPLLQSLGPKEILKSHPSLKDLSIEDCPMLQSLPEDGLPISLQHLQIQRCPLLTERCQKEDESRGGPEWPKVMHIPDLEIDFPKFSTKPALPKKKSSAWYCRFPGLGG
jgi:Leucine-rich repeat (LRR) protein